MEIKENRKNILLVDDEKSIIDMYGMAFEMENFNCTKTTSVTQAIQEINKNKFDAIISDINMPELNGYSFRINLLNNEKTANIPFIFLTSKDDYNSTMKGYDLSADEYISKTTNPTLVVRKVKSILERARKESKQVVAEIVNSVKETNEELIEMTPPLIEGIKINHLHLPFMDIPGGDFIDYIKINEENTAVVLCDTQGKKWNAWLVGFALLSYVRSIIRTQFQLSASNDPAQILDKINKFIYNDEKLSTFFSSISVVVINSKTKEINYCGAGDLPLLLLSGNTVKEYQSEGLVAGITEEGGYTNIKIPFKNGDTILLITDGVTDIDINENEKLGFENFIKLFASVADSHDLLVTLKQNLAKTAISGFTDDLTIIEIKNEEGE